MAYITTVSVGSKHADGLLRGRKRSGKRAGIIGIAGFSDKYSQLVVGAKGGCPFALMMIPRIKKEIIDAQGAVENELSRIRHLVLRIIVSVQDNKIFEHDITRIHNDTVLGTVALILLFDDLAYEVYKGRLGATLSTKESWHVINRHKKRIRRLLNYCYRYENYGFKRNSIDRTSKEWRYMVSVFGDPTIDEESAVVQMRKNPVAEVV